MKEIESICLDVRRMHDTMLSASGIDGVSGSCLYASFLLQMCLTKFAGCTAMICGGDGENDGGTLGADGKWYGHYWVEGNTASGEEFIADITADQFGFEPVVLLQLSTGRNRYVPGDAEAARWAVSELENELRSTAMLAA